ncbi:hypothetical protein V3C99_018015 [Haemonchus contortus]
MLLIHSFEEAAIR